MGEAAARLDDLYDRLMAAGQGDGFDRHVLACMIAKAAAEPRPLTHGLGLSRNQLQAVVDQLFPAASWLLDGLPADADQGELEIEEEDFRGLLLQNGTTAGAAPIERWLACILARRSLEPNHLWQDLGLRERGELTQFLMRHFHPIARQNDRNMKWKKFFYRAMCEAEGMRLCKSPVCDSCSDYKDCFGEED